MNAFSLSRRLPKLALPRSAATVSVSRPRPQVGRPGNPAPMPLPAMPVPTSVPPAAGRTAPAVAAACSRCGHSEADHPIRYACDKYPHPDPLQICGCEVEEVGNPCPQCGHSGRHHKPRHRCLHGDGCHCWAYAAE